MHEITLSEAKFSLEDFLTEKLGMGASAFLDLINGAASKEDMSPVIASIVATLDRTGKGAVGKALFVHWLALKTSL